jgi:hypothetical protein
MDTQSRINDEHTRARMAGEPQPDRAFKYVEQLEAHMDEGGLTTPGNVRDLIQTVRELCGIITTRDYDLFYLRKSVEVQCFQCRKPISNQHDVYRCTDCSLSFHRDCARLHFSGVPSLPVSSDNGNSEAK